MDLDLSLLKDAADAPPARPTSTHNSALAATPRSFSGPTRAPFRPGGSAARSPAGAPVFASPRPPSSVSRERSIDYTVPLRDEGPPSGLSPGASTTGSSSRSLNRKPTPVAAPWTGEEDGEQSMELTRTSLGSVQRNAEEDDDLDELDDDAVTTALEAFEHRHSSPSKAKRSRPVEVIDALPAAKRRSGSPRYSFDADTSLTPVDTGGSGTLDRAPSSDSEHDVEAALQTHSRQDSMTGDQVRLCLLALLIPQTALSDVTPASAPTYSEPGQPSEISQLFGHPGQMASDVQADHEDRFLDRSEPTASETTGFGAGNETQFDHFDEDEIEPEVVPHAPSPVVPASTPADGPALDAASRSARDAWLREGQALCDSYGQVFEKISDLMKCVRTRCGPADTAQSPAEAARRAAEQGVSG